MGTDIHGIWQAKQNGQWVDIPSEYNQSRHYMLFAWLGNVRNGFGFAGVPTHDPLIPLSDCRGLPDDFLVEEEEHPITSIDVLSPWRQEYWDSEDPMTVWMGDHSHSWVTAEEVLTAKLPKVNKTGIISIEQYRQWDGVSSPSSWCGGVGGPGIKVNVPSKITKETTHVSVIWEMDTAEEFDYFINEVRMLRAIFGEVRFVFGFDS